MDRRGWAGKVIDPIHFDKDGMNYIVPDQLEVRMREEMSDVILAAREKIIDTEDVFLSIQERFTEVAAQETSASGYQDAVHLSFSYIFL
jgi:hypothetical protein